MFQSVLATLVQVNIPLSLPVLAGVILTRWKKLETRHLLTVVLYVLSPCLIFNTLIKADISTGDVTASLAFSAIDILILWSLARMASRLARLPDPEAAGLTLVSTLTNSVNYGLPLVLLAFGQAGLEKASVYVVIQMVFVNTFGVFFAARSRFSGANAFKAVFSLPSIYAAALALGLRATGLGLPEPLMKGIAMIAQAYSPLVLFILGAQMAGGMAGKAGSIPKAAFGSGLALRLLLAPLVAWLVLAFLGVDGILRSVLLVEASMPVAVNSVILAEKFDAAPALVTRCILWTTLASFALLPFIIVLSKM